MVWETYYRRRSRKPPQPNTVSTAQETSTLVEQSSNNNNSMDTATAADYDQQLTADIVNAIDVGSVYEISHLHLPPITTPLYLRSIRVAMVSEKTEMNVAVRYPSVESLGTYFSNSANEMYPALDDKFVMGTALATKVLFRQVPSQEFAENKHLKSFWLVDDDMPPPPHDPIIDHGVVSKKGSCLYELKGNGMIRWGVRRQVKFLGRHTDDIISTNHDINTQSSSCFLMGENVQKEAENGLEDAEKEEDDREGDGDNGVKEEEENDDDEEEIGFGDADEMEEIMYETKRNVLKRKQYNFRDSVRKAKKVKRDKKQKQKQKKMTKKQNNKCRQLMELRSPKDRWSAERYKTAEMSLLEVMKAKEAVASKPMLRPELRSEARKKIGDTGLLDHLLKHVAGKLAPGGKERFRRRHNAEGQMEYWLERADLVSIRKEAGVTDPFWIPPPGWQPGDSPTQDPMCAKEMKLLKEEILKAKREAQEMVGKKQLELEDEVRKLRRDVQEMMSKKQLEIELEVKKLRREIKKKPVSKKKEEEDQANVVSSNPSATSQQLNQLATSLISAKLGLDDKAPDSLEKCKEQLIAISDLVKELQEKIEKLVSEVEEKSRSNQALMEGRECFAVKEKKQDVQVERNRKGEKQVQDDQAVVTGQHAAADDQQHHKGQTTTTAAKKIAEKAAEAAGGAEGKAAKIERLKSGFRICKPQGTFLWPNMARNSSSSSGCSSMLSPHQQVVVQVEDLFTVPTPPSVSSSSGASSAPPPPPPMLPYHNHPASPVKPLAERRGVTVTVSTVSQGGGLRSSYEDMVRDHTTTNKTTTMINLNDAPFYPPPAADVFCANPSSRQTVTTTTTVMPHLMGSKRNKEMNAAWGDHEKNVTRRSQIDQEQHSSWGSSAPPWPCLTTTTTTQTGNWLALATPNATASDESSSHI